MHQSDEFAKRVGRKGKPEAYYFPPQYNQLFNNFPHTYMGLEPGTTKEDIRVALSAGAAGIMGYCLTLALTGWSQVADGR